MGLSAAEWTAKVDVLDDADELRRLIMRTDARGQIKFPDGFNGWRYDQKWQTLLRIFLVSECNVENLDFLEDIDRYLGRPEAQRGDRPTRQNLLDNYVEAGSRKSINISDKLRTKVAAALKEGDDGAVRDALDESDREITGLISADAYTRFKEELSKIQSEWARGGKAQVDVVDAVAVPHEAPSNEDLDDWNAKALKAMSKNTPTAFFQSGVLVIVTNKGAGVSPPGLGWMQQEGFVEGTVTKKGGLFSTATVVATGVRNKFDFEGALRAADPDILIEYPESSTAPKPKVSAFGRK